jgi:hypothetical protein
MQMKLGGWVVITLLFIFAGQLAAEQTEAFAPFGLIVKP